MANPEVPTPPPIPPEAEAQKRLDRPDPIEGEYRRVGRKWAFARPIDQIEFVVTVLGSGLGVMAIIFILGWAAQTMGLQVGDALRDAACGVLRCRTR